MKPLDTDIHPYAAPALGPFLLAWITLAAIGCSGGALLVPQSGFSAQYGADHPLIGQVYRGATHERVAREVLFAALGSARYVVLGETHDNPDHHQLQAQLLQQFLTAQPGAAVAFEMLDEDDASALAQEPRVQNTHELAERVDWANSGWPELALYQPIFDLAFNQRAPIIAAHPNTARVRASMHGVEDAEARELQIDQPLSEAQIQAQYEEIRESHCGHASEPMLTAMQRAQVYKDAFMAHALLQTKRPTALIAGRGHARNDRAVPYFLARAQAGNTLSIALIEVSDDRHDPAAYDTEAFDYAIFTPRTSNEDPCEKFRQQLQQMRQHPGT